MKGLRHRATGSVVAVLSLFGLPLSPPPVVAPPAPAGASVDYGYDAAHTFAAADPAIATPLGSLWSTRVHGTPVALLAADGFVFALVDRPDASPPQRSVLFALDAGTGAPIWHTPVATNAAIAYGSGVVAVAGANEIAALVARSGKLAWQLLVVGVDAITPADGELYADAAGGTGTLQRVVAIGLGTGSVTWSQRILGAQAGGPLTIAGDRLYRSESNQSEAFNRITGAPLWRVLTSPLGTAVPETPLLWRDLIFRTAFTPGSSQPGGSADGAELSAADGAQFNGPTAEIVSGVVGLGLTGQGVVATGLDSNAVLWSADVRPLAALNGEAVAVDGHAIELRNLRTGKLDWHAALTSGTASAISAVGNHELVIGAGHRITALVAASRAVAPRATVRLIRQFAVYGRQPAVVAARLRQPGIRVPFTLSIKSEPFPFKRYGPATRLTTTAGGTVKLTKAPRINTIYRISRPSSSAALALFELIAMPNITYAFGHAHGLRERVRVSVSVPPSIALDGHEVALYERHIATNRYELLGTGTLGGAGGRFAASFEFRLDRRVARGDTMIACVADLYKQGVSFGDRLDRRCGAPSIKG